MIANLVRTRVAKAYRYNISDKQFTSTLGDTALDRHCSLTAWTNERTKLLLARMKKQMNRVESASFPPPNRPTDTTLLGPCIGYLSATDHGEPFPLYAHDYHDIPCFIPGRPLYSSTDVKTLIDHSQMHHTAIRHLINDHASVTPLMVYNESIITGITPDRRLMFSGDVLAADESTEFSRPNCTVRYHRSTNTIRLSTHRQIQKPNLLVAEPGCFQRLKESDLTEETLRGVEVHLQQLHTLVDCMTGVTNQDVLSDSASETTTSENQDTNSQWIAEQKATRQATVTGKRGREREIAELTLEKERNEARSIVYSNPEVRAQDRLGPARQSFGQQQIYQLKAAQVTNMKKIDYVTLFNTDGHSDFLSDSASRNRLKHTGNAVLVGTELDAEEVLLYNELRELLTARAITYGDDLWRRLKSTFRGINLQENYGGQLESEVVNEILAIKAEIRSKQKRGAAKVTVQFIDPSDLPKAPPKLIPRRQPHQLPITASSATTQAQEPTAPTAPVVIRQQRDWHVVRTSHGTQLAGFHKEYEDPVSGQMIPVTTAGRRDGYYPRMDFTSNIGLYDPDEDEYIAVSCWQDGWATWDNSGAADSD